MSIKVIKFGGTLFNQSDAFKNFLNIINHNDKLIIVISAFGKTTSNLKDAAIRAMNKSLDSSIEKLNNIFDFHKNIIFENFHNLNEQPQFFNPIYSNIKQILEGINLIKEISPRILDKLLNFGENLALETISYMLSQSQIEYSNLENKSIIITDNYFGRAKPNLEETQKNINEILIPSLLENRLIITKGYVGITPEEEQTTMGVESSNLSAALICSCLDIKDLIIVTDVDGIRNVDPKIVINSYLIKNIDYETAYNYSISGLKLLYPAMIKIAKENNIKIEITSVKNIEKTVISNYESPNNIPILILNKNLIKIKIQKNDNKLIEIFEKFKNDIISFEIIYDFYEILINLEYNTNKKIIEHYIVDKEIYSLNIENISKEKFPEIITLLNTYNIVLNKIDFNELSKRILINFKTNDLQLFINYIYNILI